ncbi:MAG TPA: SEC-C metal-binding domain-containing protein, partial [Tepidisphaeraceae bacterium]|nr:SEC-C metal-binding domain-containing protein [Tepidisphaeraceae bacterium]
VLEGRDVDQVVWTMITDSTRDAVDKYVTQDFVAANIAEWARSEFDVTFEPGDFKGLRQLNDLEEMIKNLAKNEVATTLPTTLGEYLGEDANDNSKWAYKDLINWARIRFRIELTTDLLKRMDGKQLEELLRERSTQLIDERDFSPLGKFLEPHFALDALCDWAEEKFSVDVAPSELAIDLERGVNKPADDIVALIDERARKVYRLREARFPIDYIMTMVYSNVPDTNDPQRAEFMRNWIRGKYGVEVAVTEITGQPVDAIRDRLYKLQDEASEPAWQAKEADKLLGNNPSFEEIARRWFVRFGAKLEPSAFDPATARTLKGAKVAGDVDEDHDVDTRDLVLTRIRQVIRHELTGLEQNVLISIFDQSWKDHLYAMDVLKGSIGLQGYAERDPRVAFKREGFRYFREMMITIRDKVTDVIFRVNVGAPQQAQPTPARSRYQITETKHEVSQSYDVGENTRETGGVETETNAEAEPTRVAQLTRETKKVGRNELCPCGSGKKFKNCCGQVMTV